MCLYPGVAKFGIALDWGSRGRRFKSCHSDHFLDKNRWFSAVFIIFHNFFDAFIFRICCPTQI